MSEMPWSVSAVCETWQNVDRSLLPTMPSDGERTVQPRWRRKIFPLTLHAQQPRSAVDVQDPLEGVAASAKLRQLQAKREDGRGEDEEEDAVGGADQRVLADRVSGQSG